MMAFCMACGARIGEGARFCAACGKEVPAGEGGSEGEARASGGSRRSFNIGCVTALALPIVAAGVVLALTLGRGGCSSVQGRVEAHGKPLGDYVVAPTLCQSGEHQSFFGVTIFAGEDAPGTLIVVDDPVRGRMVRAVVDGSCRSEGDGGHVCSYVGLEQAGCSRFEMAIKPTNTSVNDVRLIDGRLAIDCKLPEGGTLSADLTFEDCD